ncbi:MAG: aldehyde dehydrogenase family protein [Candidatus Aminicenantes bacterium]|nr:aldehyde dehydrogenase family protein [Candidatus Aminicenantes bacterium]NIM82234.1 aldehyde dehydrogenase family protein [Candidatus Aminicenantes bacterium]NIN20647.1 aldehyde dehydrogenase family protein [Candidatus Aminicenantes bacterium]NIN44426.1 aldehyde dehydrogenase family protein [Candidatus Aminicenantes bacterium]NIN87245.1 aldehyde dehydrogenase family protein [Candidatus Aminicenantes bacterium]
MKLTGEQIIGSTFSKQGAKTFNAVNPVDGQRIEPSYYEAAADEVDKALHLAQEAFLFYRKNKPSEKAAFLERIADEILALGDELIQRCMKETALPEARLEGERGRTVNQLKLFARVLLEGSWVEARIDTAIPDREPVPKPDLRRMLIPLGPVGVFGASNFPLAFSVAGGDTASALAAGCPVVVKAHPAHPGTSEMVSRAILKAAQQTSMPEGIFSMVHGQSVEVGMAIVNHPFAKAIGFTGSFKGGKALFDAAVRRPEPIPVYAEMGSTNPVFLLPGALKKRGETIAKGLAGSVTLGVGQFCTNPGLVFVIQSKEADDFINYAAAEISAVNAGIMLTDKIKASYNLGIETLLHIEGVEVKGRGKPGEGSCQGIALLMQTTAEVFLKNPRLEEEVFGPSTIIVTAADKYQLMEAASYLRGHLTATLHHSGSELEEYAQLVDLLESRVGRLLMDGFPTGVEVCPSMHHGGPFPATTDVRTTSVGTAAIKRFARPICYQNFPHSSLPDELKDENPLKILRLVNGQGTRDKV